MSFLFEVVSIAVEKFESAFASLNLAVRIELYQCKFQIRCNYRSSLLNCEYSDFFVRTVNSFISMQAHLICYVVQLDPSSFDGPLECFHHAATNLCKKIQVFLLDFFLDFC